MKTWKETDELIDSVNAEADERGNADSIRLKHTFLSDKTPEERKSHFGRMPLDEDEKRRLRAEAAPFDGGRRLQSTSDAIDWRSANKVIPIQDQGYCGSCYAFAGNTALSSYIAIKEGKTPMHLSDQQVVDCS